MTDMNELQTPDTIAYRRTAPKPETNMPLYEENFNAVCAFIERLEQAGENELLTVMKEFVAYCKQNAIPRTSEFKYLVGPYLELFDNTPYEVDCAVIVPPSSDVAITADKLRAANGAWNDLSADSVRHSASNLAETNERVSAALLEEARRGEGAIDGTFIKKLELHHKNLAMQTGIMKALRESGDIVVEADEDDAVIEDAPKI